MSQFSWATCPPDVRGQVEVLVREAQGLPGNGLVGIYLHGSLAMGCFNPERSDLDVLIVTREGMTVETKRRAVHLLLAQSGRPHPIEISFLRLADLHPWQHPAPFDLHFSEAWRRRYEEDLASGSWKRWNEQRRHDPDLAAHVTITRRRGVRLSGAPIDEVFPIVPRADYVASIMADFEDARDRISEMPVYGVLNLCRVHRYLLQGEVSSKDEAGSWALRTLPPRFRGVVEVALQAYRGEREEPFDPEALEQFARHVDEQVRHLLQRSAHS